MTRREYQDMSEGYSLLSTKIGPPLCAWCDAPATHNPDSYDDGSCDFHHANYAVHTTEADES